MLVVVVFIVGQSAAYRFMLQPLPSSYHSANAMVMWFVKTARGHVCEGNCAKASDYQPWSELQKYHDLPDTWNDTLEPYYPSQIFLQLNLIIWHQATYWCGLISLIQ